MFIIDISYYTYYIYIILDVSNLYLKIEKKLKKKLLKSFIKYYKYLIQIYNIKIMFKFRNNNVTDTLNYYYPSPGLSSNISLPSFNGSIGITTIKIAGNITGHCPVGPLAKGYFYGNK
ncbi:hypothetical protein QLL95_gp1174 [Cotonvirus japonicus]|uniref:Uncharacterized protein n=1 Tax=Cotonvirus japonicus TaxID=2811091 RepID=A0ABM7NS20_9VIRU|nr:hypothetical protein QLL95_gp1174 [Cotonvirus japonicus]BCS82949.1 hypothetical protein [Cotonvirus japonicus]